MRMLGAVFVTVVLLSPGLAAGQGVLPLTEPPVGILFEAPPPFDVAQGPAAYPAPPHGDPRLGVVGPGGPGPLRPPRPIGMMAPGPGAWWKDSEVVKKLELSEAQVSRIEQAYLDHRLRLVDLRAELEKQELGLQPFLDTDRPDEIKVAAQLDLITAARGKLEKTHAMMLLAIRRVLSVEQWKRLQALQQERGVGNRVGPEPPPAGPGFAPARRFVPPPPR